jgi:hypothetical protein
MRETRENAMAVWPDWIRREGIPPALYCDHKQACCGVSWKTGIAREALKAM